MRKVLFVLSMLIAFVITGCATADAGKDQVVKSGDKVILDGSKSKSTTNKKLSYKWKQILGKKVKLENANSVKASFIAPDVKKDTKLKFVLTANEIGQDSVNLDYVSVLVKPVQAHVSKIKLLSPTLNSSIKYTYVTLEVDDNIADVKAKVNGVEYIGIKNDSSFFIYNVALKKGKNSIELTANNGSEKQTVDINSEAKGFAPIAISADKKEGFEKLDTTLTVQTKLSVNQFMLDKDNDGVLDEIKPNNTFIVNYKLEGRYFPIATVKTSQNILYSTRRNLFLTVKGKPKEIKTLDISEQVYDLERFSGYIWALSSTSIYKIDENNNSKIERISIGNVNNPKGFCYDSDKNLYIADTGNHRILKLLANSNYQPDNFRLTNGSFGSQGSENGQFESPSDCMVDSTKDKVKIFVVDSGNNRIQVFNDIGRFLYKFNSGVLNNPQGLLASSSTPIISDSGNNFIRFFDRYGRENYKSKDVILNNPTKVSLTDGGIIVSDTNNNRLVFLTLLGDFVKELKLGKSPLSAIQIFNKNNNIYIAYNGKNGVSKLSGKTDYPNENPKDIVQKFVKALNNGDSSTMRTLTVNKKIVDAIFTTKQYEKLLPYLKSHIKEYQITFQDKSFASVLISFDNTEHTFKVGLLKYNNQWLIHKF